MDWRRAWLRLRKAFLNGGPTERDLEAELQFHLAEEKRLRTERGEHPDTAEREARRAFGSVVQTREATRAIWASTLADQFSQDIGYAARTFARTPGFTIVAALTLALGIGVTTAVFSVADLLLFRRLPFADEDRLVSIGILYGTVQQEFLFGAQYIGIRNELQSVEAWTSFTGTSACDIVTEVPRRVACARVEANFVPTLGLDLALGRNFTVEEDRRDGPRRALISYGLWLTDFGGEPSAVGSTIPIDGVPHQIIGVLGSDFELPTLAPADIVLPQRLEQSFLAQLASGPNPPLRPFGRLRPGMTPAAAEAELSALIGRVDERAGAAGVEGRVRPVRDRQIGRARTAAWILLGVVSAVLLIVSANVANLMLARATSRRPELGVRTALGAGQLRIARQLLTESLLLGVAGGAAGCGLAAVLLGVFVAIAPGGIPRLGEASIDWRVLLFALVLSLGTGVASGLAPLLTLTSVAPALRIGRGWEIGSRRFVAGTLVVVQIAVSLVLLTGATLLVRSFRNLQQEPLWTGADQTLIAEVSLAPATYSESGDALTFFAELENRLRSVPGLDGVAISDSLPPFGEIRNTRLDIPGQDTPAFPVWRYVTPAYFNALDIPILQGQSFLEDERMLATDSYVISESLARRVYGTIDVVGESYGDGGIVVGIAGDVQNRGLAAAADPEYYVLRKDPRLGQWPAGLPDFYRHVFITVRTGLDPASAAGEIRRHVAALDPTVPVTFETLGDRLRRATAAERFNASLIGLFAILAVVLACVGLYGVTAFIVVRRTPEFGLRMAVGATHGANLRLVLRGSAVTTMLGLAIGTLGALATSGLLSSLLYEIPARDIRTLAFAAILLALVSFVAALIAARRVVTVDPLVALRHE